LALALVISVPVRADAQTILDSIWDAVNTIRTRVETAITQAQAARSAAEEIRTQVRTGVGYMTTDVTTFIANAVEEGRTILADEWAGMEAFAPGGQCLEVCQGFRADLVELLTLSVEMTSTILTATSAPANPDLSRVIALAQSAPPRTLYPIYRMLEAVLASELPARFREIVPETQFVLNLVIQGSQDPCIPIITHADRIQRWSSAAMGIGVIATVIGKLFNALGHTEIEASAGAMGFAGGTLKANGKKKLGEVFTGLGTIIDKVATFGANKTRFCLIEAFQNETRTTLAALRSTLSGLNLDLTHLDTPVSSRATQTSVNQVQTTLTGVARDVSALLDLHGGDSSGGGLTIRVQIERQLGNREPALAVFYLPEGFGGVLERVREIVADNVTQHQAAGYPVGDAWRSLAKGDAAKAQSDFRTSYGWYQNAYLKITSDKLDKREK
jgi:hypothetical protein